MKKIFATATLMVFWTYSNSFAQNVAINDNGATPNTNAILDIDVSTNNKGILVPRITTAQRTAIAGLAAADEGLTVYDETTDSYWFWSGTAWVEMLTGASGWKITGNGGTNASTNFLGTTDAVDLVIRTGNTERMRVLSGGNVGIGTSTPLAQLQLADIYGAGGKNLLIGDDAYLTDVDVAHTLGLYSNSTSGLGRLALGAITETIGRTTDQTGSYGSADAFDFDDAGSDAGIIVESGSGESGGFFANGNTAAIWSPGDGTGGILSIYDEDGMNLTTPVVRVNGSGDLEARNGLYTRKRYTYFTATRVNGGVNTYSVGTHDFCSLASFSEYIDEDDGDQSHDLQCNVFMDDSGMRGDGTADNTTGESLAYNYAYNSKPNWRLYIEAYGNKSDRRVTCSAVCIDFDY